MIISDISAGGEPSSVDPEHVREYLTALHGRSSGLIVISAQHTGSWSHRFAATVDEAVTAVLELERTYPIGIFCRVTTLAEPAAWPSRGSARTSFEIPGLWADLDIAGVGHKDSGLTRPLPNSEDAAMAIIREAGYPLPDMLSHSGGGLHGYWLLPEGPQVIADRGFDWWAGLSRRWHAGLGEAAERLGMHYGVGVADLARILRIPGSINRKDGFERPARLLISPAVSA